jgi:hypothetical protein
MRTRRSGPGLAAALAIAAAAAAGCSGTAATAPAQSDSRHLLVGRPCSAQPDWAAVTLTDTSPTPMVTVPPGGHLVVTVPSWGWGTATDVHPARAGILREQFTVLLPDEAGARSSWQPGRAARGSVRRCNPPAT